jgi:hypothetical protein
MGRAGSVLPGENVIATIIPGVGSLALPLLIPFAYRFGRENIKKAVILLSIVTALEIAIFARMDVFDAMHQKRVFVLVSENVSDGFSEIGHSLIDFLPFLCRTLIDNVK